MREFWALVDEHAVAFLWSALIVLGVAFWSQASTEKLDRPGLVGIVCVFSGCLGLYRAGIAKGRDGG